MFPDNRLLEHEIQFSTAASVSEIFRPLNFSVVPHQPAGRLRVSGENQLVVTDRLFPSLRFEAYDAFARVNLTDMT